MVLSGGILTAFHLFDKNVFGIAERPDSFTRMLREYDVLAGEINGAEKDFERMNRELDKLEKRAIGVESWLSVLKRRRNLARLHPPSIENYRKSVNKALEAYPLSQHIAAIAAEALVKDAAINREAEQLLRKWLPLLTDPFFNTLRLGLHVILGDFRNPASATHISSGLFSDGTEDITVDLTILKILLADIRGAAADIQTMLYSNSSSASSLNLAAEFYYDFGDLRRSAEIFFLMNDERAMIRAADALYLAGFRDSAKSIWSILAESPSGPNDEGSTTVLSNERSLYNLGVTSENNDEAAAYLERLINTGTAANTDGRQFGLIRYSRLLDLPQALLALEKTEGLQPAGYPFIDLEICRRQAQWQELGRQLAEAWLLLDRHPENEDLYQWAVWLFLYQRNFSETKILLSRIENLQFTDQWARVYRAIQLMFEGDIETAEDILFSIPSQDAEWPVFANLGRIMEAQRSPGRALEQYELAAAKVQNPKTAARIQLRIARCFSSLGRASETLRAIEYALELDPENLTARLELDRLTMP